MIKMRGGIPALLLRLISKGSNQNPLKSQPKGWDTLFYKDYQIN